MKKLLLHSCCAPCSSGVIEDLREIYDVTVYYYNPNIFPKAEYEKRANEQVRYLQEMGVPVIIEKYNAKPFNKMIKGLEKEPEGSVRCIQCFKLRLQQTAKYAKKHNFDTFTTTLSVSPHKNDKIINSVGHQVALKYNINFLSANFKKNNGYLKSLENSKKHQLYRQNYCGCKYSLTNNKTEK